MIVFSCREPKKARLQNPLVLGNRVEHRIVRAATLRSFRYVHSRSRRTQGGSNRGISQRKVRDRYPCGYTNRQDSQPPGLPYVLPLPIVFHLPLGGRTGITSAHRCITLVLPVKIRFPSISDYLAEAIFFSVRLSGVVATFVVQSFIFPDIVSF